MENIQIPIFSNPTGHPANTQYLGKHYLDTLYIDHYDTNSNKQDIINTFYYHPIVKENVFNVTLLYWWHTNKALQIENLPQYQVLVNKYYRYKNINQIIPYDVINDNCKHLHGRLEKHIKAISPDYITFNQDVGTTFGKLNTESIIYDGKEVYQNYNVCTATGRPSNAYDGINLAALPPEKRKLITPKNSNFILFDYSSYHVYLIADMLNYKFPQEDVHGYLMKEYGIEDRSEAKKITFRQLYGGVEPRFKKIEFFRLVDDFIKDLYTIYLREGAILSKVYNRPMTITNLGKMSDTKLFNYYLQSYETERNMKVLLQIHDYLYKKKTTLCLYNYDGFLFDMAEDVISDLSDILTKDGFPATIKTGQTFGDMNELL